MSGQVTNIAEAAVEPGRLQDMEVLPPEEPKLDSLRGPRLPVDSKQLQDLGVQGDDV